MKELSKKLADNLAYYVNDPKKRCSDGTVCKYSGVSVNKKTKGCFVGKLLSPKDRLKADNGLNALGSSVSSLCLHGKRLGIKIPKIIKNNLTIMMAFQGFHDCYLNWKENGLSDRGKYELLQIIEANKLHKKYFKKFLVD